VTVILSDDGQDGDMGTEMPTESVIRSRRLRDRFSREDLQTMIDLYRSGATARQVAEKFGVSLRSVKRLLHQHGIRRERLPDQAQKSYNLKEEGRAANE
jgi:transposase-like protein